MPSRADSRVRASSGSAVVNEGVVDVVRHPSPRRRPSAYGFIGTSRGSNSAGRETNGSS
jgi:hypothetical protein